MSNESTKQDTSALALATGSLPVWQRELFDLADEWDGRARRAKLDEEYHRGRNSDLLRPYQATWATYSSCAEELRRQIVAANVRQPEENADDEPHPEKSL